MRIKDLNLLVRKSGTKEVYPQIFVVTEGTRTEVNYFREFFKSKNLQVNVFYLFRDTNEVMISNPKLLFEAIERQILNKKNIDYRFIDIFDLIDNDFSNLNTKVFRENFESELKNRSLSLNSSIDKKVLAEILDKVCKINLLDEIHKNNLLSRINKYFEPIIYDSEIDKIALIVDRDRNSFTEEQYNFLLKECPKRNIDFVVTNPCFEFFLLLHFSKCSDISRDALIENKKGENGKTFVHNELKKYDVLYSKRNFDVKHYLSFFDIGYENSKQFSNDINVLVNEVGTNLFDWIINIIHKYKK